MGKDIKEQAKQEASKELAENIIKLEEDMQMKEVVKDNKLVFEANSKIYRIRKLNHAENLELNKFRRKKYLELINDDDMLFRKQWIEKYRKKGIDIEKMEKEMNSIQTDIEKLMVRLATTNEKQDIEKLRTEIIDLRLKQASISNEKTNLLSYSIEDKLTIDVNSYYTYLALEIQKDKDKWEKAFSTYENLLNSQDDMLLNKAFYHANFLIYQVSF